MWEVEYVRLYGVIGFLHTTIKHLRVKSLQTQGDSIVWVLERNETFVEHITDALSQLSYAGS